MAKVVVKALPNARGVCKQHAERNARRQDRREKWLATRDRFNRGYISPLHRVEVRRCLLAKQQAIFDALHAEAVAAGVAS